MDNPNFPSHFHTWRLSQILQKGSCRTHRSFLNVSVLPTCLVGNFEIYSEIDHYCRLEEIKATFSPEFWSGCNLCSLVYAGNWMESRGLTSFLFSVSITTGPASWFSSVGR